MQPVPCTRTATGTVLSRQLLRRAFGGFQGMHRQLVTRRTGLVLSAVASTRPSVVGHREVQGGIPPTTSRSIHTGCNPYQQTISGGRARRLRVPSSSAARCTTVFGGSASRPVHVDAQARGSRRERRHGMRSARGCRCFGMSALVSSTRASVNANTGAALQLCDIRKPSRHALGAANPALQDLSAPLLSVTRSPRAPQSFCSVGCISRTRARCIPVRCATC